MPIDYHSDLVGRIPRGWRDATEGNDACPSMVACTFADGRRVRVFTDAINPDHRDCGGARFAITVGTVDDFETVYESDDWDDVLAEVTAIGIDIEAERSRG